VKVIFGVSFLDEMDWLFGYDVLIIFFTVLLHSASVVSLGFVYRVRPKRESLIFSFVGLVLIYFVVAVFTMPMDSVNYVFLLSNFFGIDALSIFWVPLTFLVVVVPTYWFQVLVWRWVGR